MTNPTFDPIRFQRELHNAIDRRRSALATDPGATGPQLSRLLAELCAVEEISDALAGAFVANPPPSVEKAQLAAHHDYVTCCTRKSCNSCLCGLCEKAFVDPIHQRAADAERARPTWTLDAEDRARLRAVVNVDTLDDGARILLHRLINATDKQRNDGICACGHPEAAHCVADGTKWVNAHPYCRAITDDLKHCDCNGWRSAKLFGRTDRFTIDEGDAVRVTALASARETLRMIANGDVCSKDFWRHHAECLAQTILAIFGEEK